MEGEGHRGRIPPGPARQDLDGAHRGDVAAAAVRVAAGVQLLGYVRVYVGVGVIRGCVRISRG